MLLNGSEIRYGDKKVSRNALVAMVIGGVLLLLHVILLIASVVQKGTLPMAGGVLESYMLLFGIFGFFWSLLSYDDERTVERFKKPGVILNLVSLGLSVLVMAIGFMTYEL